MKNYLDFEKEIKALEQKVDGLKSPFGSEGISEVDTSKIKNTQQEKFFLNLLFFQAIGTSVTINL